MEQMPDPRSSLRFRVGQRHTPAAKVKVTNHDDHGVAHRRQGSACAGPAIQNLLKLGVATKLRLVVALAGNPNTGKSTVFNALTGLRQHTGNWPGKTVARAEGGFEYGTSVSSWSICPAPTRCWPRAPTRRSPATSSSLVARRDGGRGRRHAPWSATSTCAAGAGDHRSGGGLPEPDGRGPPPRVGCGRAQPGRELGVPVVPAVRPLRPGLADAAQAMQRVVDGDVRRPTPRVQSERLKFSEPVDRPGVEIESLAPGLPNARWVALRLLDGDRRIVQAIRGESAASWLAVRHVRQTWRSRDSALGGTR